MIIDEKFKIKVSKKNIEHFKNKGYTKIKLKDIIVINSDELNKGSHLEVKVKCDICSKVKKLSYQKYIKNISNGDYYACSSKCAQRKVKKTSIAKFGTEYYTQTDDYKTKIEKSNLKKYGTKHHIQSDIIKTKIKKSNLEKYGTENVFGNDLIKEKIKKTNLEKYGAENPSYSKEIKMKIGNKNKDNWKYKILKQLEIKEHKLIDYKNSTYNLYCKHGHNFKIHRSLLNNRFQLNTEICTICNKLNSSKSGYENQLQDFIKENYSNNILINSRKIIPPLELDIYLPDLKLAFEFNGLYWHNEEHKPNDYHLNKTEECEKQGIQLIHIWEDNWIYKQDIVKSMILNKLGKNPNKIYGRKTEIKEITDNKLVRKFLNTNHLQGFIGSKVKLGLFFNDELVSLMTFGKRRVAMGKKSTNKDEYELLRFCNKLNTNVLGGASKLFKFFKNNYNPKEITTYADRSHSNGGLYKQLRFEFISKTVPNYYYVIDGIRHHRFNYRKDKLIKEGFDPNKTEHQIMIDRKIFRIYDSGNLKYYFD
jgi:very-short-patch-repair endonuclease